MVNWSIPFEGNAHHDKIVPKGKMVKARNKDEDLSSTKQLGNDILSDLWCLIVGVIFYFPYITKT